MTDLRRSISPSHLDLLLQYLEQHPGLALAGPRSRHDQIQARRLWDRVAKALNKVDGKVVKSGKEWCRYWADLKCKTRRKYKTNPQTFTSWEQRVLDLLTDGDGVLLPNAHQQTDKEYQDVTKQSKKKIKRSNSDVTQDLNHESNTETNRQTDKIYIINHIEHDNDHKTKINVENNDKNFNLRSDRDVYSLEEQNNSTNVQNNNTVKHKYSTSDHSNSIEEHNMHNTAEHNNSIEENKYITSEHSNISTNENLFSTAEHSNSTEHNNIDTEHNMNTATKLRTNKTIEELKKDILEFQLKRQKELFEREKRERDERHKLEIDILRLKRDILVKELNNLT